jgi:7-keto-8-aminopelargonate synthetase-like enzyme
MAFIAALGREAGWAAGWEAAMQKQAVPSSPFMNTAMSGLGKAMGGATGGYTASTREVVDVLRNKARPYLFSNSVAPAIVGASVLLKRPR